MKIHREQKVLCVCRNGQVRSVAARHLLATLYGFKKVVCVGWEMNDRQTLIDLATWANVILVVGRPSDWKLDLPAYKVVNVEIGPDVYGDYAHPELLEKLMPKIRSVIHQDYLERVG